MGAGLGGAQEILNSSFMIESLLPFALVFAIVYGVLDAASIFEGNNDVEAIIAAAIGLFAAFYTGSGFTSFMQAYLPEIVIGALGILGLVILLGMVGFEMGSNEKVTWGVLVIALFFVWDQLGSTEFLGSTTDVIGGFGNVTGYIIIIGIVAVLYYGVTGSD